MEGCCEKPVGWRDDHTGSHACYAMADSNYALTKSSANSAARLDGTSRRYPSSLVHFSPRPLLTPTSLARFFTPTSPHAHSSHPLFLSSASPHAHFSRLVLTTRTCVEKKFAPRPALCPSHACPLLPHPTSFPSSVTSPPRQPLTSLPTVPRHQLVGTTTITKTPACRYHNHHQDTSL